MDRLFSIALTNAASATLLGAMVALASRWIRRPAVVHALWVVVLCDLLMPPVFRIPMLPDLGSVVIAWPQANSPAIEDLRAGSATTRPGRAPAVQPESVGASRPSALSVPGASAHDSSVGLQPAKSADATQQGDALRRGRLLEETPRPQPGSGSPGKWAASPTTPTRAQPRGPFEASESFAVRATDTLHPRHARPAARDIGTSIFSATSAALRPLRPLLSLLRAWTSPGAMRYLDAIWLVGTMVVLVLGLVRAARFSRRIRGSREAGATLRARADALAALLRLRGAPGLRLVPTPISPLLWFRRGSPVVLFPERLLAELSEGEQDALLLHELAHVKRRDHWVRWLEFAASAAFWWHPLLYWGRRQMRRAEEQSCDAWVLGYRPGRAAEYALGLMKTMEFLAGTRPGSPALASGLGTYRLMEERLVMILKEGTPKRLSRLQTTALLLAAAAILLVFPARAARTSTPSSGDASPVAGAPVAATTERGGGSMIMSLVGGAIAALAPSPVAPPETPRARGVASPIAGAPVAATTERGGGSMIMSLVGGAIAALAPSPVAPPETARARGVASPIARAPVAATAGTTGMGPDIREPAGTSERSRRSASPMSAPAAPDAAFAAPEATEEEEEGEASDDSAPHAGDAIDSDVDSHVSQDEAEQLQHELLRIQAEMEKARILDRKRAEIEMRLRALEGSRKRSQRHDPASDLEESARLRREMEVMKQSGELDRERAALEMSQKSIEARKRQFELYDRDRSSLLNEQDAGEEGGLEGRVRGGVRGGVQGEVRGRVAGRVESELDRAYPERRQRRKTENPALRKSNEREIGSQIRMMREALAQLERATERLRAEQRQIHETIESLEHEIHSALPRSSE